MGSVEHAHLAQLVGLHVVGEDDGVHFVQGQFLLHLLGAFDHPQAEGLGGVQLLVFVAQFLEHGGHFLAGEAGNDAVNQRGAENVVLFQPGKELIAQIPLLRGLEHGVAQMIAVIVDQLAGQDDEAGLAQQEAFVQEAGQLAGVGGLGLIVVLVRAGIDDARFGGVADDEAQGVDLGQIQIALEIGVGLHGFQHRAHDLHLFHVALFFPAPEHDGVQAVLIPEHLAHAPFQGLHDGHAVVAAALGVQVVQHFIHEGAQEAALAELHHPDVPGALHLGNHGLIQSFHFSSTPLSVYFFPRIRQLCGRIISAPAKETIRCRNIPWRCCS